MGKWGQLTPWKMDEKLKSEIMQKSSFLCLCYILRAIRADRCRQRRYADHIFIQKYFRMHHFVVKFSKFSSPQAARGHWPPVTEILRTLLRALPSLATPVTGDSNYQNVSPRSVNRLPACTLPSSSSSSSSSGGGGSGGGGGGSCCGWQRTEWGVVGRQLVHRPADSWPMMGEWPVDRVH